MLKDSLYHVIAVDHTDNMIHAVLELNVQNEIFNGHFPEHPVLPGACMLQMVKEIFESVMNRAYHLEKTDNLKFLTLIDPQKESTLHLEINYTVEATGTRVNATLAGNDGAAFKLQGTFI